MRYKIIDWTNINNNPILTTNDKFIVGDSGVNKIKIVVSDEMNDYNVIMLLRKSLETRPTAYQGVIRDGNIEFLIEDADIERDRYDIYLRIYKDNVSYASAGVTYINDEGRRFFNVTVNKYLAGDAQAIINELIKTMELAKKDNSELGEVIIKAEETKANLEGVIQTSIESKEVLQQEVKTANSTQQELVDKTNLANASAENLNSKILESEISKQSLISEINNVPTKISEIKTKGEEQIELIATQGTQEINKVTSEGNNQTRLIGDKGETSIQEIELKKKEVIEIANTKIGEIKKIGSDRVLDKNGNIYLDQWLGTEEEYLKANKYNNRIYSVFSPEGALLKQYLYKFKTPKNYFDKRISLYFGGNENGYYVYNDPRDPMPINTLNGSGLKVWEETEDYIIYIDKDVETISVEKYVVGSYQTFLERKADIEGNMELVKSYTTWTQEDDSNFLIQCNNEALEKLSKSPSIIPETGEEIPPSVLGSRTVPITYNCCFRVDRKSGEIYIGEGYENLWRARDISPNVEYTLDNNGISKIKIITEKTSNHKPFVKTIMPTCKLSFITEATSETHSFVIKGVKIGGNETYRTGIVLNTGQGVEKELVVPNSIGETGDVIASSLYKKFLTSNLEKEITGDISINTSNIINLNARKPHCSDSFKQFLIYKGNLTEQELKEENAKQIYF